MPAILNSDAEQSAAYKLFHWPFQCKIQAIHLYDEDTVEYSGIPTSGDVDVDRAMAEESIQVTLSIARMIELFSEGAGIEFVRVEDTLTIYQIIKQHLLDWKNEAEVALHSGRIPINDLQLIDEFGQAIYYIATGTNKVPEISTGLIGRSRAARRAQRRREHSETKPKPYHSLADDIIDTVDERGGS